MHDKIFSILVEQNEIGWKSLIYDIVKSEGMDPWNINISILSNKYIKRLKKYKDLDLKVSGKVLLAAALLLKIKSKRLVGEDLDDFDRLLSSTEESEQDFYDELEQELRLGEEKALAEQIELIPRTPQPRKRKVSIYDLVRALDKALEVKRRRMMNTLSAIEPKIPEKGIDINAEITKIYQKILDYFSIEKKQLTFTKLLDSDIKEHKISIFIPLLHLTNQNRIDLKQEKHFGEIGITLT